MYACMASQASLLSRCFSSFMRDSAASAACTAFFHSSAASLMAFCTFFIAHGSVVLTSAENSVQAAPAFAKCPCSKQSTCCLTSSFHFVASSVSARFISNSSFVSAAIRKWTHACAVGLFRVRATLGFFDTPSDSSAGSESRPRLFASAADSMTVSMTLVSPSASFCTSCTRGSPLSSTVFCELCGDGKNLMT